MAGAGESNALDRSSQVRLVITNGTLLGWQETFTENSVIYWQDVSRPSSASKFTTTLGTAFSLSQQGIIHIARLSDSTLSYSSGISPARQVQLSEAAFDLTMCLDDQGAAFGIWRARRRRPGSGRNFLLKARFNAYSIQIASSGTGPQIQAGSLLHAAYVRGTNLVYASSADWTHTYTITTDLAENAPLKLVLDANGVAHLAWYQNGAIYLASAANWGWTAKLTDVPDLTAFDLAFDNFGREHLVYSTPNDAGLQDIFYLARTPAFYS